MVVATTVSGGGGKVLTSTSTSQKARPIVTELLRFGSTGAQVVLLQDFLTLHGFLVIPVGIAPGYFGQLTQKAVMEYQQSLGLEPVGSVGPKTRAALGGGWSVNTDVSVTAKDVVIFAHSLTLGMSGSEVKKMQDVLVAKGFLVIPVGIAPGYFGQLTQKAVMEYQQSLGLEPVGSVGPKTRAALNAESTNP